MYLLQSNVHVSDMRIWTRKHAADKTRGRLGPLAYSVLPLSAQQTVDADYILTLLNKHVNRDGTVDTIFVEFENERLPVSSEAELPILSKMAALYHNALIAEACKRELDLYNKLPDFEASDDSMHRDYQSFDPQQQYIWNTSNTSNTSNTLSTLNTLNTLNTFNTFNTLNTLNAPTNDGHQSDASISTPRSWDEEELGEQRVFDETWEMNADLVPWNLHDAETEERFGSYM